MNISQKRILVIDDDPNFRSFVRKILEAQGAIIDECTNLDMAFSLLKSKKPDLILLDLDIGRDEHGSEFLSVRKTDPLLSLIPVIVCSSDNRSNIVKNIIDLKIEDYLIKPIRQDWLVRRIRRCLKEGKTLEYNFTEAEFENKIPVSCWGELLKFGEATCVIRSPMNCSRKEEIEVKLSGLDSSFQENQMSSHKKCKSNIQSRPAQNAGTYDSLLTMIGIGEREATFLRKMKAGWRKTE